MNNDPVKILGQCASRFHVNKGGELTTAAQESHARMCLCAAVNS